MCLLKAHEALLSASELLKVLRNLRGDGEESSSAGRGIDFVELGSVWQAPFYEIVLKVGSEGDAVENGGQVYYMRFILMHFILLCCYIQSSCLILDSEWGKSKFHQSCSMLSLCLLHEWLLEVH